MLTQETQHGWMARLGKLLAPKRMETKHQHWLEALRECAVAGAPPEVALTTAKAGLKRNETEFPEG